jgi:hypothetical protein
VVIQSASTALESHDGCLTVLQNDVQRREGHRALKTGDERPGCIFSGYTAHLVNKVAVGDLISTLVQERAGREALQPCLALLDLLLRECKLQARRILVPCTVVYQFDFNTPPPPFQKRLSFLPEPLESLPA